MNYKSFIREGKRKADITPLLGNSETLSSVVEDLYDLFKNVRVDKVVCVEANGFIFGTPLCLKFKAGFVPVRKPGELQNETYEEKFVDYTGKEKVLEIHKDSIKVGEKVLLVDDWLETGSTMKAAVKLVQKCGGSVVGIGVFMDDSTNEVKKELEKYNYKFVESGY